MGVRISDETNVCLYCSTEELAFGPTFSDEFEAQDFLDWLGSDPRALSPAELTEKHRKWSSVYHEDGA